MNVAYVAVYNAFYGMLICKSRLYFCYLLFSQ